MALRELEELHLVTMGESLESIARSQWLNPVTRDDLLRANPQLQPYGRVYPSDAILIPRVRECRAPVDPFWNLSWQEVNKASRQLTADERELFRTRGQEILELDSIVRHLRHEWIDPALMTLTSVVEARKAVEEGVRDVLKEFNKGSRAIARAVERGEISLKDASAEMKALRRELNVILKSRIGATLKSVLNESMKNSKRLAGFLRMELKTLPKFYRNSLTKFNAAVKGLKASSRGLIYLEFGLTGLGCAEDVADGRNLRECTKSIGGSALGVVGVAELAKVLTAAKVARWTPTFVRGLSFAIRLGAGAAAGTIAAPEVIIGGLLFVTALAAPKVGEIIGETAYDAFHDEEH